jgi:MFS family permease
MEAALTPSVRRTASDITEHDNITASPSHCPSQKLNEEKSVKPTYGDGSEDQTRQADEVFEEYPEGGLQAWLVVLGSVFLLLPTYGFMCSIGTLQDYWRVHQLKVYSPRDIGWIPSVFVYLSLGLGIFVGPVFDRYGPRFLVIIGTIAYIIVIFALAECTKYWHFMLCLSVAGGFSAALITTAGLAAVSHWFDKRRGRAAGVSMIGNSIGGMIIPLILRAIFPRFGWAWSIRILGFILTGFLIIGNILIKGRLTPKGPPITTGKRPSMMSFHLFADARFSFLSLAIFGMEIILFGALGILPTYATSQGYPSEVGYYLIAVMNGISCLGRFFPSYLSDYVGRFNTLLLMLFLTLVVMLVLWLPFGATSLPALYAFAALFGFGTGSWMALVPVCIGQLCRTEEFGRYWGTCYFVASLATLVCVPIGGELIESVGARPMVAVFCAELFVALFSLVLSRWACLGWKWKWRVKI